MTMMTPINSQQGSGFAIPISMIAIVQRWVYCLLIATVSTGAFCFLFRLCEIVGQNTFHWYTDLHPGVLFLGRAAVTAVIVGAIIRLTPIKLSQRTFLLRYPPTWLGIAVGFAVACLLDLYDALGPAIYRPPWWEWPILAAVGLSVVSVVAWITAPLPESKRPAPGLVAVEVAPGLPALERWLSSEAPAEEDFLDRRPIARRIARRLLMPLGQDKTIGLVGGFGSGKSTIVRLLMREANAARGPDAPALWFCEVSCWGFDDSPSAVQHILSNVLKELSTHVDCFSLRHLPDTYRKALSAGGSWLPSVADMFLSRPAEYF